MKQTAIIIGAGPAGLTAALELLRRTAIKPIVLESSREIGGISRTIRYKGNRMDIGGHRFFSKSDRVMQWWMDLMPLSTEAQDGQSAVGSPDRHFAAGASDDPDLVMLIRPRKSRIFYLRKFFDYPIALSLATLRNLGFVLTFKVGVSYIWSRLAPIRPEKSLEDFLINRFGRQLYLLFFKSYTEKVWGTPCDRISAEWGAQRIKELNLVAAVKHFLKKTFSGSGSGDLAQKGTDTSLIERFMYPKLGPGQLWEHAADEIQRLGGEIHLGWRVDRIHCAVQDGGNRVTSLEASGANGERRSFVGDYFFSTMPMKDLVEALDVPIPENVREVSRGLEYRDFITVGLLVDKLRITEPDGERLKDTWIYVQESDVLLGRLQIFNNWSPYLVADPAKTWIGLEYFCYETDDLWKKSDEEMKSFAIAELEKIGLLNAADVRDSHVVRVPKTYPAYFGTYARFDELREFTDSFENLFLVGRNGMHKYNNQDHSMLTAMTVVDGLIAGRVDKAALWSVNTEQEYHEERK